MDAVLQPNTYYVTVPKVDLKRFKGIIKAMGWTTKPATEEFDITKTAGFKEAMDDVKHGRVTEYESAADMFQKLGITPAMRRRINKARREYAEGQTISCKTPQEMQQFFDSL